MASLYAPQMVKRSRMLYFTWVPEDKDAVRALVPAELELADNSQCFINQYVVDSSDDTSGFEQYSLTYAGLDVKGQDSPQGIPGRWWTHYLNSNADMVAYAAERGVPAEGGGETVLEISGGVLTATTSQNGTALIRTTATVRDDIAAVGRGQLSYLTKVDGQLIRGFYPFVASMADGWEVTSMEFLDPSHPIHALRPASPLEVTWGFYSPDAGFCYPGGEGPVSA
ncbi:MAG: acetoacetate decarboxylase family protein [Thermoleophilia bacterium]|nr:acetoacetate decarboxylase family protein [Thermoleophilia bacterium]